MKIVVTMHNYINHFHFHYIYILSLLLLLFLLLSLFIMCYSVCIISSCHSKNWHSAGFMTIIKTIIILIIEIIYIHVNIYNIATVFSERIIFIALS